MKTTLQYGLKFYVRDSYSKNANKRGGQVAEAPKKNQRAFKTYLSLDIIDSQSILKNTRHPFSLN